MNATSVSLALGVLGVGALIALAVADGSESPEPAPSSIEAPSGFRFESGPLNEGPVPVRAVSFPVGADVAAGFLSVPDAGAGGRMPAVVYLHGLGADGRDFVTEAQFMAGKRTITLALDSADVGAEHPPLLGIRGLEADLERRRATTRRGLRAIELLSRHPQVDPERIALVGFSRGGAVAARIAERSPDLAAEIYISAGARLSTWPGRIGPTPSRRRRLVSRLVRKIDPVQAAQANRWRRPRLVQLGTRDRIIPIGPLRRFSRAVPEPKTVRELDAGHPLTVRALYQRLEWLERTLGLDGSTIDGAPELELREPTR